MPWPVLVVVVGFGVVFFRTSFSFSNYIPCMFRSIRIRSPATCLSDFVVLIAQCVIDQKVACNWPHQQCPQGGGDLQSEPFERDGRQ